MKSPVVYAAAALIQTALLTGLLLWARPMSAINAAIDRVLRVPASASQHVPARRNPDLHELSFGENPIESFRHLAGAWTKHPGVRRIVLTGNSQLQQVTLAGDESLMAQPEATVVDWLSESYAAPLPPRSPALCYRLSAGALSYTEMLWMLLYLANHDEVKPDVLVLQANYQGFWNAGLRDGMLSLLDDPAFAAAAAAMARPGSSPFAETFEQAIEKHRANRALQQQHRAGAAAQAPAWQPAGQILETRTRETLTAVFPLFNQRADHKEDFLNILYRGRVYLLGLRASSARSLSGPRLERSRASLEAIAALCGDRGIRMVVYDAPVNPRVSLFKTEADRAGYLSYLARFSKQSGVPLWDLSAAVPDGAWGRLLDGPDPLHLSRAGHRRLAEALFAKLGEQGF